MQINNKKEDILMLALQERYNSTHKIRERVQSIGIWSLGIMLAAGGWLITNNLTLDWLQKIIIIFGLLISFYVFRFIYLEDLKKGFETQQKITVNIENMLGLFTPGVYEDDKTVYPEKWKDSGTKNGDGKFFKTTYYLLYVGIIFFIFAILFHSVSISNNSSLREKYFNRCEKFWR